MFDKIYESLIQNNSFLIVFLYLLASFIIISLGYNKKSKLVTNGMLIVTHLILLIVSIILDMLNYSNIHDDIKVISQFFGFLGLLSTISILIFKVTLPKISIMLPLILQDLITAASSLIVFFLLASKHGYNISGLIATSAVVTAVIGFSLQDTLINVMGGLSLQMDNSIKEGDWIKIDDKISGKVVEIRWRHTAIETRNWETVIVPNSIMTKSNIVVLGRREGEDSKWRRWIYFNIDFRYSPTNVIQTVLDVLRKDKINNVAESPQISCILMDFTESYNRYAVRYWLTDFAEDDPTDSEIRTLIYFALKRADIPISIPAYSIFLTEENNERKDKKHLEEMTKRITFLKNIELFKNLSMAEIEDLATKIVPTIFKKGEMITKQGSDAHWLYMIRSGSVSVHLNYDGIETEVGELHEGNFFGEMSLMTGDKRSATINALTDIECYKLDKLPFKEIINQRKDIALYIADVLAKRKAKNESVTKEIDKEEHIKKIEENKSDILEKLKDFFGLGF